MSTFGWTEEFVCEELTGAKGWAFYTWAVENRATIFGAVAERSTPGYIAQEVKRLKALQ